MAFFGEGLLGEGAAATGVGEASGSFGATGVGGAAFSGEGAVGLDADGRRRGGSGSRSGFAASLSVSRACSCERLWFGVSVAGAAGVGRAAGVVCGPAGIGFGGVCGFSGFGEAAAGFLGEASCFLGEGCGAGAASAFGKKLGLFGCRGAASASGFGGASAFSGDGRLGAGAFAFF